MDHDNIIDPRRPYANEIELLKYLHAGQDTALVRKQFSYPLASLYGGGGFFDHPEDTPEPERISAFLKHVLSLSKDEPAPQVLETAPLLDEWCAIHDSDIVILIGIVTGHPHLRHRARAHTSLVFQVHPEHGWARTWNRYYRLGTPSRMTFFEWQHEGKLSPAMQIVEFD